jgi:molybdopterin converting factor subunit 1
MTVTVRLFARAKDLAGTETVSVALSEGATVADLRRRLAAEHPRLGPLLAHSAFAMNHEFADDAAALVAGTNLALLPPVSGG